VDRRRPLRPGLDPVQRHGHFPVRLPQPEEGLGLGEEDPVIADVVDDPERLPFQVPEAPAELLKPEDPGLGGAKHENGVHVGEVHPLIEHVHRADHIQLAGFQPLQ